MKKYIQYLFLIVCVLTSSGAYAANSETVIQTDSHWNKQAIKPIHIDHPQVTILRITIPEDMNYNGAFDDVFEKYLSKSELTDVKTSNMGTLFTISYSIHLKDESKVKEMIDELRTRNGNLTVVVQMDPQMFMKL